MDSVQIVLISPRLLFRKTFSKVFLTLDSKLQIVEYAGELAQIGEMNEQGTLPSQSEGLVVLDCAALDEEGIVDQMLTVFSYQPETGLVVVLDEQNDQRVDAAMNNGATGVLIKASPPQVLVDMLQRVLDGNRCRPKPTVTIAHDEIPKAVRSQLSARRQKLLRLMMGGQSISSTASTLGMTPAKVVIEMRAVLAIVRGC